MKLLPTSTRVSNDDSLGRGMDAVFTLALFLGLGYLLDRWLGTQPVFMIVMVTIAAIGLFLKFKYRYDAAMSELEEARRRGTGQHGSSPERRA